MTTRVSLIGTIHQERGLVTAEALLQILQHIQPQVIFLECPPSALDTYFNAADNRLEAAAVDRYRTSHGVALVPVDLPTPPRSFFYDGEHLSGRLERVSHDYCRVLDEHRRRTAVGGFRFLNSAEGIQSFVDTVIETEASLAHIGNPPDLLTIHQLSQRTMALRDTGMMTNIEHYCLHNSFSRGAFLVGAGHRQSLIDKAQAMTSIDSFGIEWDFDGFLAALP
jgi:hypothetical protein